MGIFKTFKNVIGKTLKIGGNVLKTIGDIGGRAAEFAGRNAAALGGIAGTGLTLMGLPEFGIPVAAAGQAIGAFANSKPTKNVIRGINDVANASLDASKYIRR